MAGSDQPSSGSTGSSSGHGAGIHAGRTSRGVDPFLLGDEAPVGASTPLRLALRTQHHPPR